MDAMTNVTLAGNITMPYLFGPNSTVGALESSDAIAKVGGYQNATDMLASNATMDQIVGYCSSSFLPLPLLLELRTSADDTLPPFALAFVQASTRASTLSSSPPTEPSPTEPRPLARPSTLPPPLRTSLSRWASFVLPPADIPIFRSYKLLTDLFHASLSQNTTSI
jgi:hypothetical protein